MMGGHAESTKSTIVDKVNLKLINRKNTGWTEGIIAFDMSSKFFQEMGLKSFVKFCCITTRMLSSARQSRIE
jgi:hypothetical protein